MEGLIGKKIGMTQIFDDQGHRIPVTVIEVGPCPVVQVKTTATDGYNAVQLGFEEQKPHRMTKSMLKHFEKASVKPCRITREFPLAEGQEATLGEDVTVNIFEGIKYVDVSGISKGRGFSGPFRRWGFSGGHQTHGGHSKRRVGSIGACTFPGEVQKGKKMPGHMGAVNRKARNLTVVEVRGKDNLLLVRGSIPGPIGGVVIVKKALKK
ncbi:MAG: 50S ribosomal protein L3 [Kiritimatiellae bacterium]|nr:50S ribosomal protein L3 [Kiritimatiellia bacterium]